MQTQLAQNRYNPPDPYTIEKEQHQEDGPAFLNYLLQRLRCPRKSTRPAAGRMPRQHILMTLKNCRCCPGRRKAPLLRQHGKQNL